MNETAVRPLSHRKTDNHDLVEGHLSGAGAYDRWVASQGIPVRKGYYVEDLRNLELGWWEERGCYGAFLQLVGQEGVSEVRVAEIGGGKTLPPLRFAFDEIVYVVEGRGLTTVWEREGGVKKTFEWQKHSMFLLPRNCTHQMSSTQGEKAARLLHFNALPTAMSVIPDPQIFFEHSYAASEGEHGEFYSEARKVMRQREGGGAQAEGGFWYGNLFPNMRSWDKLEAHPRRGGGQAAFCRFPHCSMWAHVSVFPAQTYKKAHRHGPARMIVILAGEGYSIMWQEGKEKVVIPWHEASVFVPPKRWFHQHFNVGGGPARYLALHPSKGIGPYRERLENRLRDQIEYPDEEPWIRERFEAELAERGLRSLVPDNAYRDRNFVWSRDQNE